MIDNAVAYEREDTESLVPTPLDLAHQVDLYVGQRLRLRRTEMGLTQQQLADALGISYQQIQKYETGGNRVNVGKLFVLARALNVPLSFFIDDFEGTHVGSSHQLDEDMVRLARLAGSIRNRAIKRSLAGLIKTLAKP